MPQLMPMSWVSSGVVSFLLLMGACVVFSGTLGVGGVKVLMHNSKKILWLW